MIYPIISTAEWHGNLKLMSDYIYRGYSKSRGNPVIQGQLDYQAESGWYSGLGISQLNFDESDDIDRSSVEFQPYAGQTFELAYDLKADLSVTGYIFDQKLFNQNADYVELSSALHYKEWLSGRFSIAPDAYQRQATTFNYELNQRHDLLDTVQFSSGLGFHQAKALLHQDYFYWNAGFSWFPTSYLALDFRYIDVALNQNHHPDNPSEFYPQLQENKYLFSMTVGF